MIPTEITVGNPSAAERNLFQALRRVDLGGGEICLHSLELARHLYQRIGEIDFVILGPRGVLLLEVKGGRVHRDQGLWVFQDRYGKERRENRGPIKQVEDNMWSLIRTLEERLHENVDHRHLFGFGIVFPDVAWNITSVEWDQSWILDRPGLDRHGGLKAFLNGLYAYWEQARRGNEPMPAAVQDRMLKAMRPDFDVVPGLRRLGEAIEARQVQLTENQYEKLDFVENLERALVSGGAGTGKTLLALHVARREAAAGRRVLLACHSPMLAVHLRQEAGADVAVIGSTDAVPPGIYETLVVDEGQDLLRFASLDRLGSGLAGGLESGRWRVFFDPNNQAGLTGDFDPDALAYLVGVSQEPFRLTDNCRNTRPIVEEVRAVTGADTGVSAAGDGPAVEVVFWATQADAANRLAGHLDRLLDAGVAPETIAILSPRPFATATAQRLPERLRKMITDLTAGNLLSFAPGRIVHATIADFKGLERRFVAVTDIEQLDATARDLASAYVGLTRARAGLWIAFHESLEARVRALHQRMGDQES